MNKPDDESNFLIEITPALHDRIKMELGDGYLDNYKLHYSPYWKMMQESDDEDE